MSVLGGRRSLADIEALIRACGVVGCRGRQPVRLQGQYRAVLINYPQPAQRRPSSLPRCLDSHV